MTDLFSAWETYVRERQLFGPRDRLLVAVSGGLDSTVLARLCAKAGLDFVVAHMNFGLRGPESDRDEAFVSDLAKQLGKPFRSRRADTKSYAADRGLSIQEAARELRYGWFEEIRRAEGLDVILTAHQADDNIETAWLNFLRGTGIAGLRGMQPRQGFLARPLLFAGRDEVAAWAADQKIDWVEDSSNHSDDYTRNEIRRQLLPLAGRIVPGFRKAQLGNLSRLADAELLYREAVEVYRKKLMFPSGNEVRMPVLKLLRTPARATLLHELLKPYGFSSRQAPEAEALLHAAPGKWIASSTHRLIRHGRWLIVAPPGPEAASLIAVEAGESLVPVPGAELRLHETVVPQKLDAAPSFALLDAAQVKYPLVFRRAKPGDYFYPLGMTKKKKIARFLVDQKLSKTAREQIWVLESGGRIAWVAGHRIDNRFRVQPKTRRVLQIELRVP